MTRPTALLTASLVGLLLGAGCSEKAAPPAGAPEPTSAAPAPTHPPIPGVKEADSASDRILVDPGSSTKRDIYKCDDTLETGALRVICRISTLRPRLPRPTPVDFSGPTPIQDPVPTEPYRVIHDGIHMRGYDITSETDYYGKWNPPMVETPLTWIGYPPRGGSTLTVNGAAIIIEGIKAGAREQLPRGSATVNHRSPQQYILGWSIYNGYQIAFVPKDEKLVFRSGDRFPCTIEIRELATGEPFGDPVAVRPFTGMIKGKPGRPIYRAYPGWHPPSYAPPPAPSPTFRKTGVYSLRCRRHPWHTGYAVIVDNPYVAVSGAQRFQFPTEDGKVTINEIPPGTWTVRVWHPRLESVKELHQVTIETDETTPLVVEFKPPKELLDLMK